MAKESRPAGALRPLLPGALSLCLPLAVFPADPGKVKAEMEAKLAAHDGHISNYIQDLLVDKEMPLLGIRWNGEIFGDAPLNNEPEGANPTLRRAQIGLSRGFGQHWSGKVTLRLNNIDRFEVGDSYLSYSGLKAAVVQAGIFDPAYSLESVSKTAGLTFMERSLPVVALSENKSGGIGVLKRTANSIYNAGLFFLNTSQDDQTQPGQAIVLHYTHTPIDLLGSEDVGVGLSFSYRFNTDADRTRFRTRPEIATADDYYVDTQAIEDAEKVLRMGFETHKEWGRLSWQSEVLFTGVERDQLDTVQFWGAYAFLSWFLTNDSRNYDAGQGWFRPVEPSSAIGKGGRGAWELALRGSYVDLTDKDIIGGKQSDLTLGLNWYLNSNFRLMGNLTKVLDVDRPGNEFDGLDPLILSVRLQWQML